MRSGVDPLGWLWRGTPILAGLMFALLGASPADASRVYRNETTVWYAAADGETNRVELIRSGDVLRLIDPGATIEIYPWDPCSRQNEHEATCPLAGITSITVALADRDDSLTPRSAVPWLRVEAGDGQDEVNGGSDGDRLFGGHGRDHLTGGEGNDVLFAGAEGERPPDAEADRLDGGSGDDFMNTDRGPDQLIGGDGSDSAVYDDRPEPLFITVDGHANDGAAGEGGSVETDVERVYGGRGNDTISAPEWADGGYGDDVISDAVGMRGGPGDDTLTAGPATDHLDGGTGSDRITGNDSGQEIMGDGYDGWGSNGFPAGPEGNDILIGAGGDDKIYAGGGDDVIDGGAGADTLFGYAGDDRVNAREPDRGVPPDAQPGYFPGGRDAVYCGPGTDEVLADFDEYIAGEEQMGDYAGPCESVIYGEPPVSLPSLPIPVTPGGEFTLPVYCGPNPATGLCEGSFVLQAPSLGAPANRTATANRKPSRRLARGSFRLPSLSRAKLQLRLNSSGRSLLRRRKRIRTRLRVTVERKFGPVGVVERPLVLRAGRR